MQHDRGPVADGMRHRSLGVHPAHALAHAKTVEGRRGERQGKDPSMCRGTRVDGVGGKGPARSRRLLGHGHTGTPGCGLVRSADEPVVLRADDDRGP